MASPARRQYLDIKAQHQDALLAYQIGDFYEFFDSDARIVARELQIVLTARSYGPGEAIPLAGVPTHALETYLARLVARGYKVAVCDQVSPPGKGLVQRAVTRILTPGTVVEPNMVPARRDNYLVALAFGARGGAGLAVVEASTGAFACVEWEACAVARRIARRTGAARARRGIARRPRPRASSRATRGRRLAGGLDAHAVQRYLVRGGWRAPPSAPPFRRGHARRLWL